MSDGPHRSLPLPTHWKKFAERVYKPAFPLLEMTDAATDALLRDFRKEVPHSLLEELGNTLFHEQPKSLIRTRVSGTPRPRRYASSSSIVMMVATGQTRDPVGKANGRFRCPEKGASVEFARHACSGA